MDAGNMIELKRVEKTFDTPKGPLTILKDANLAIRKGEKVAILGPSGSGKSTLLSLIAGLDVPTKGSVVVDGQEISSFSETELASFRNAAIGIVFQSFELILPFTVFENVEAPLAIAKKRDVHRASDLLERVRLTARRDAFPETLSGGEKQRVAIARALANNPPLLLADEPTGSLDRETGRAVLDLLLEEVERQQKTLVVITHDESIAQEMDRVLMIREKEIYEHAL